jgi:hypothetical protein
MKPRIRRKWGVWSCSSIRFVSFDWWPRGVIGYGYTPKDAYRDWKEQQ